MKIRDKRKKGWFIVDNEYLNGYAKYLGVNCTVVYLSLCRHADIENQTCYPSMELIAEENGIHRTSVIRAIKILSEWSVVSVKREKDIGGKQKNNVYTLLDKTEWKEKPSSTERHGTESLSAQNRVAQSDCKDTHIKETHIATSVAGDIVEVLEAFKSVNPSYKKYFGNKTHRACAERLIKEHGKDVILATIAFLQKSNADRYAPTVTNAYELEEKLGKLKAWSDKIKSTRTKVIL